MTDSIQEHEYGPDARTEKRYEDLQSKSKAVVDEIVDRMGEDFIQADIADAVGCTPSHVSYVQKRFPHVIENRRSTMRVDDSQMEVAADGGAGAYNISLRPDETFKAIKLLPEELSAKIFNQIRTGDDHGAGLEALFEPDDEQ